MKSDNFAIQRASIGPFLSFAVKFTNHRATYPPVGSIIQLPDFRFVFVPKHARTRLSPEKRKLQLLDTARQMIVADGLQNFTMESLAKNAGVTTPLVYNYFPNRAEVLQKLLQEEYRAFNHRIRQDIQDSESFEDIVRVFITSNFDHFAAGNILPILQSQPEIMVAIKDEQKANSQETAEYLVSITAKSYKLTVSEAELVANMSSGASIAAAQYASRHRLNPAETIELALCYVLAGMQGIANSDRG